MPKKDSLWEGFIINESLWEGFIYPQGYWACWKFAVYATLLRPCIQKICNKIYEVEKKLVWAITRGDPHSSMRRWWRRWTNHPPRHLINIKGFCEEVFRENHGYPKITVLVNPRGSTCIPPIRNCADFLSLVAIADFHPPWHSSPSPLRS